MTDEKFEDFLRNAAKAYNTPPARTPREEMWNAIQAKRSAGPRVVYGGAAGIRSAEKRFGSKVWWAAAAGIVLVASGIGIGRLTAPAASTAVATVRPSAVIRPESTPSNDPARGELPSDATRDPADAREAQSPFSAETSRAAGGQRGSTGMVASSGTVGPRPISIERAETSRAGTRGSAPTLAYEMAEVNHLTAAEALLTSFRTRSPEDQQQDARLAAWARELLSNTRLLLDSPVAADPQRRPLLQDLELLLVQIVQLAPGTTPQDREIMERTLKQDQLMTRLRTAIPAGQHGS